MQIEINPNLQKELINLNKNIKNDYRMEAQCYDSEIFHQYLEEIENITNDWNYKLVSMQIKKLVGDTEIHFFKQFDEIDLNNSLVGLSEKFSNLHQNLINALRLDIIKYNFYVFDGNDIDDILNVIFFLLYSCFYKITFIS